LRWRWSRRGAAHFRCRAFQIGVSDDRLDALEGCEAKSCDLWQGNMPPVKLEHLCNGGHARTFFLAARSAAQMHGTTTGMAMLCVSVGRPFSSIVQ
jgi:hypothetical protein